ncbi:SCO6745 family protein [Actinokineospora sp. HUAS TT18]|uniref:SCO6745 family protein n=1 Tax=Actinokineospora sp. HUAS TT18 TaxID=3447451 RepID=UPI003F524BF0
MDPRQLWLCFEPYHDVTYFTPESIAETDALGCKGRWMGYFGMRAAPLGAAPAWLVTSLFYNFHPSMVERALPEAWDIASPAEFLRARLAGVDAALRRMLGDEVVEGQDIAEAADIARAVAPWIPTAGRPLGAANAALELPEQPHLALWQVTTTLRESRGDGHVAALVTAGLDECETLVLFGADKGLPGEYLRAARKWSEGEWTAADQRLRERGLLGDDGALSDEGRDLRDTVEALTDEAAAAPWIELGEQGTARLVELLAPLSLRLSRQNEVMRRNPMGLDPEAALAEMAGSPDAAETTMSG